MKSRQPAPERPAPAQTITRREFTSMSVAACLAAAAGMDLAAAAEVTERDVQLRTPDGLCDAALAYPSGAGRWPAAILFVDAFGLRPAMRDMARRLAADGYVVLAPNPYYRMVKAPGLRPGFDFQNPDDRARLGELRAPLTNDAVARDAAAYAGFLDGQPSVDGRPPMGAFGYCMGGLMTLQAAAGLPQRIAAGASFHGGGLVTDKPDSPHRLVPRMKGRYYIAIAASDDAKQPEAKTALDAAFRAAGLPARIEVYAGTGHGWCVRDMPLLNGQPIYNEGQAERAWRELTALFKEALR